MSLWKKEIGNFPLPIMSKFEQKNVKLEICDAKGVLIYEKNQNELPQGEHTFLIEKTQQFSKIVG